MTKIEAIASWGLFGWNLLVAGVSFWLLIRAQPPMQRSLRQAQFDRAAEMLVALLIAAYVWRFGAWGPR